MAALAVSSSHHKGCHFVWPKMHAAAVAAARSCHHLVDLDVEEVSAPLYEMASVFSGPLST